MPVDFLDLHACLAQQGLLSSAALPFAHSCSQIACAGAKHLGVYVGVKFKEGVVRRPSLAYAVVCPAGSASASCTVLRFLGMLPAPALQAEVLTNSLRSRITCTGRSFGCHMQDHVVACTGGMVQMGLVTQVRTCLSHWHLSQKTLFYE